PSNSEARFASTSLTFMLLWVPDPVCHTTSGNSSSCRPASTSSAARAIASAFCRSSRPSATLTRAAQRFTSASACTTGSGMRSPEIRKKRRLRSVCAPQRRSASTSMGPKLSFSTRVPAISRLRKIEEQNLCRFAAGKLDAIHSACLHGIARLERDAIHLDLAAREVQISAPARRERMRCLLAAVEQRGKNPGVLVDLQRSFCAVGRSDQPQAPAFLVVRDVFLLVFRRNSTHVGLDPDLQKMRFARFLVIELAVLHAAPGAHALDVARHDRRAVAAGILVRERPFEHVADDLHVAVAVRAEACPGADSVFVNHAQWTEAHVLGIVVVGKRE